uniref:NADH-ubiquinone oxidoreductase chain 1 n=1 Tax=Philanthus triangulum TaxID=280486 RepID=H9A9J5_9HYME|nr:NADH dehydrogenase subunit 1 [Philanthus triangulum]AET62620.1 NADH dehydrogenase subunit 1 [Philanthus triangulum]
MSLFCYFCLNIVSMMILIIFIMIGVAFLTLMERKVLGYIQDRKGPNKNFYLGMFQPFSDAIKLLLKEVFLLGLSNYNIYYISPIIGMMLSMLLWLMLPFYLNLFSFKYGLMFLFCCFSLSSYFSMFGGWASNSNYSMLGSMRSVSQSISYEVSMILVIFLFIIMNEGFSLKLFLIIQENFMYMYIFFPIFFIFLINMLAELNRTPFDLIEGESELVSGFNIEYFGGGFTLIFLSEYMNIMFVSFIIQLMFLGLNFDSIYFLIYFLFFIYFILWIRGVLPRIRYDNLMYLCWKKFLPISLNYLFFVFGSKVLFNMLLS